MGEPAIREPSEDPRHALGDHLAAVRRQQVMVDEIAMQWQRLKWIQEHEARARKRLEAVKANDIAELSQQLVEPTGLHIVSDHDALSEAEFELRQTTRDADVARACEPEVAERRTESLRRLDLMKAETIALAAKVMVEEASAITAEIAALTTQLRIKHAQLWGLKNFIGETAALRRMQEQIRQPDHPDTIAPSRQDVLRESKAWERFAVRLSNDHWAKIDEEQAT